MKYKTIAIIAFALLAVGACGKKSNSVLNWLPSSAASKEEFQQAFPQSCMDGSKKVLVKKDITEDQLTPDVLQKGCGCTLEAINALPEEEWNQVLQAISKQKQPEKGLRKKLRDTHKQCFASALSNG